MNRDFYRLNIFDILLILFILIFSTGFIVYKQETVGRKSADLQADIFQNGQLVRQIDLNKTQGFFLSHGSVKIEYEPGRIRIAESDCSRKICVHTGWIETPGRIVACVPNRIMIEILSEEEPFLDAIVN